MNKLKVKLNFNLWYKHMTPQRFFKGIPYLFNYFEFVKDQKPDFLICGRKIHPGNYKRIFYTPDGIPPVFFPEGWSLAFDYEDNIQNSHYMRFPNYVRLGAGENLIKKSENLADITERKTKFCAFVYSHNVPIRNEFFKYLFKYKKVDSPGSACQNMDPIGGYSTAWDSRNKSSDLYKDKIDFFRPYKFVISFENVSYPGYVSEKIYHAMLAGCIPIYWGNPLIKKDFNTSSFISAFDQKHKNTRQMFDYLVDRVMQIDRDDNLYVKMLEQPWYCGNKLTKYTDPLIIIEKFKRIFNYNA